MIILDSTVRSLNVVLGGVPTGQLPVVATYVDVTPTTFVPGASTATTNSTTPVVAVASPAASTQRQVKFLSVANPSGNASVTLTLEYDDNGTEFVVWKGALAPGYTLLYTDGEGLRILDANGGIVGSGFFTASIAASQTIAVTNVGTFPVQLAANQSVNVAQWNGQTAVQSVNGAPGIGGDTAAGQANAGNPLQGGGVAATAQPSAVTAGQRVAAWYGLGGAQVVGAVIAGGLGDGNSNVGVGWISPSSTSSAYGAVVAPFRFNNSSWDRERGNFDTAALVTLASTAASTVNSSDQTNYNSHGLKVGINITALGAATTVTVNIQIKSPVAAVYTTVLSSTAIATTGFTLLTLFHGLVAAANSVANDVLSRTWRIQAVVAGSNTASGTVEASVLL